MRDKLNAEAMAYFRKQGARGGKLGAKARMLKLTPEQRSDIARNAVRAREEKRQNGTHPKPAAPASASTAKKIGTTKKKGRRP